MAVSGNNTITTLERLKAMPGVFVQTIKQGKSIWFAIGELVDLITGKADKPITGTDMPTDPPAYEGQICSVNKSGYQNILVGVKGDSSLEWRQVAISSSSGLPIYNNVIIGGVGNVIESTAPYGGIFCGRGNNVRQYAAVCIGGGNCTASGAQSATIAGERCTASDYTSVTIGGASCTASGSQSVTIGGGGCTASKFADVCVGGSGCEAGGSQSATIAGQSCKTTKTNQVAMGQNNDPEQDDGNVLFMVGGGTSNSNRANVFTISKTGVPKALAGQYNVPCCKTGITAPDTAPDYVGQEYLDAAQKKVYKAFGTTDASDWVAIN